MIVFGIALIVKRLVRLLTVTASPLVVGVVAAAILTLGFPLSPIPLLSYLSIPLSENDALSDIVCLRLSDRYSGCGRSNFRCLPALHI